MPRRHSLAFSLPLLLLLLISGIARPSDGAACGLSGATNPFFETTHRLPTDELQPTCSVSLLRYEIKAKLGSRLVSTAVSAFCSLPWSSIVLDLSASQSENQPKRVSALWFDGVEIFRTTTVETAARGAFWRVRKDITRYSSLFLRRNLTFAFISEPLRRGTSRSNVAGFFRANFSLNFYSRSGVGEKPLKLPSEAVPNHWLRQRYLSPSPADVIFPISRKNSDSNHLWFTIEKPSDVPSTQIAILENTYRAVLEVYISAHSKDEFWYSNAPEGPGPSKTTFRQAFATVDGVYAGSFVPVPVVYSGGIDALFWDPIIPTGAFDLPSYDLDLTPFLPLLLAKGTAPHSIGLGIDGATSAWFVDANLHLWIDKKSAQVEGRLVEYRAPAAEISWQYIPGDSKGNFKVQAERRAVVEGWVVSSLGNITTRVSHRLVYQNQITEKADGSFKDVTQTITMETLVREEKASRMHSKSNYYSKYPLQLRVEARRREGDAWLKKTILKQDGEERMDMAGTGRQFSSTLVNKQESEGWLREVGGVAAAVSGMTEQKYSYRDGGGCYVRNAVGGEGRLVKDRVTLTCVGEES